MPHESERLARAVRPNIFDAFCDTELVLPLVLANLASPRLWALSEKLRTRVKDFPDDNDPHGLSPFLRAARKQIDRDFEHLHPETVSELLGDLDLATEAARLGEREIATAIESIERAVRHRIARGTLQADGLLATIAAGRFPAYTYGNIDLIRANRRLSRQTRAPSGLTSCLDEVAIFAALAMTLPGTAMHDMVLIGAPSHYTAFGRDGAGRPFWFFGKNALYAKAEWDALVATAYDGDVQKAFDDRLPTADRILGIEGLFDFATGASRIAPAHLQSVRAAMTHFFGALPEPLKSAFEAPVSYAEPSAFAALFRRFLGSETRAPFEHFLRAHDSTDDVETDLVAASFRSLKGCDPHAFLLAARRAALRNFVTGSTESILAQLQALPSRESIFNDRDRIAMPDETLAFGGNDRDVALLLHVALERKGGAPVETLLTGADSFVCCGGLCVSTLSLSPATPPEPDSILYRW